MTLEQSGQNPKNLLIQELQPTAEPIPEKNEDLKNTIRDFYLKSLALNDGEQVELKVAGEVVLKATVEKKGYRKICDPRTNQFLSTRNYYGFVEFNLNNQKGLPKSPYLWAGDFFMTAIEYFKNQGEVLGVAAFWPTLDQSVNSVTFWEHLGSIFKKEGLVTKADVEEAIGLTWTAKQASKAGFSIISSYQPNDISFINQVLRQGDHTSVQVNFVS